MRVTLFNAVCVWEQILLRDWDKDCSFEKFWTFLALVQTRLVYLNKFY